MNELWGGKYFEGFTTNGNSESSILLTHKFSNVEDDKSPEIDFIEAINLYILDLDRPFIQKIWIGFLLPV